MTTPTEETHNSVGALLREKRREKNLSLKEAEIATSIRMAYLKAIEEDTIATQVSPVYAQGFIRQYATYLGLDGEELLQRNPDLYSTPVKQEFSYGIGTLEMRGNPGGGIKWIPNAVVIAAFAGVLLLAWGFARYLEVL